MLAAVVVVSLLDSCTNGALATCSALYSSPSTALSAVNPAQPKPGDVPPAAARPQPIESIADKLAADGVWIGMACAADLATTSWALRECPTCFEGNPLGPDVEARVALKAALFPAAMGAIYLARRWGHDDFANGMRYGLAGLLGAVSGRNAVHAVRGR